VREALNSTRDESGDARPDFLRELRGRRPAFLPGSEGGCEGRARPQEGPRGPRGRGVEVTGPDARVVIEQPINWPTLVIAVAAFLSAIFAAWQVFQQGRSTRRQLGIQNMWRLIDRWDGLEEHREQTAKYLLEHWDDREDLPDSAHELLGTFELLAYLVVRSETLSLEDAWINFSGPAIQWWHVCRPGIEKLQEEDPTVYEDYAALADQLMDEEAKRRKMPRESLIPSDRDLRIFLGGSVGD
jgi:hypothetical protein